MATLEEEEMSLSPKTEENLKLLLKAVHSGKMQLERDANGRFQVLDTNERTISLTHVDRSKAHTIQEGKDDEDKRLRVHAFLEMIEAIKRDRAPSGVVLDRSKAAVSPLGQYEEGKQFENLQEVLGKGNCAGDIMVVRDKKTGVEQAVKTVMISQFSTHEVRAWVKLGDSEQFPSLYLFYLKNNKVVFHMEKIEHGVTLTDVIDNHMNKLRQTDPSLVQPFSLCVFHGVLSAVKEMHDKKWTHQDLHGENVMLTKDSMMLKVLDFGLARPLVDEGLSFNHSGMKSDILNAIRLFCGLYIGQDFESNFALEKEIKAGTLKKVLSETSTLGRAEREELFQLIMMTYQVTREPEQAGYGNTSPVMRHIEGQLLPDDKMTVMRRAAAILFPEIARDPEIDLRGGRREGAPAMEAAQDEDDIDDDMDVDLDEAAPHISQDFMDQLSIHV